MIVTYYGETKNTRFGAVMFEADRLLKNLTLGRDNYTGKRFRANLQGYHDLLELYQKENRLSTSVSWRMWFVPEKISLIQSEDGSSMVFDQVQMQVLTESKCKKGIYHDNAAEKFASHFTQNYDRYSHEFPILHDLKKLGKITAVVKWIKEQGLPFDLSFFKSYSPKFVTTPTHTPQVGGVEGRIIISGGVIYHFDDNNFSTRTGWQANEAKDEVLQGRPGEGELSWDFGKGYTAIVQNLGKTLKVGDVKKSFVDMSFPVAGTIPLALVRTYDSFNEQSTGFGTGWDVTPAKLRFLSEKKWCRFSDGTTSRVYNEIFVCWGGAESLYRIVGLNAEKNPVYSTEGRAAPLLENLDGTFSFSGKQECFLFDSEGKLIKISDKSGMLLTIVMTEEDWPVSLAKGRRQSILNMKALQLLVQ